MDNKSLHKIHSVLFLDMRNQPEVEALIHDLGLVLIINPPINPSNPICDKHVAD